MKKAKTAFSIIFLCTACLLAAAAPEVICQAEAYRCYSNFIPGSELFYDDTGELCFTEYTPDGMHNVRLKYADRLEFDKRYSLSAKFERVDGMKLLLHLSNPTEHYVRVDSTALLLRYLDGAWYHMPGFRGWPIENPYTELDVSVPNFRLAPGEGFTDFRELCFYQSTANGESDSIAYTLPSGSYALFYPLRSVREQDGETVAVGQVMLTFELVNERPPRRYEFRGSVYDAVRDFDYRVENVSAPLYADPYE